MDEKVMHIKIDQHSPEVLWFKILREKWNESFWEESSRLREFANRLGLAIVPISVMPFSKGGILAKYIDYGARETMTCSCSGNEAHEDLFIERYLLHLVPENEVKLFTANSQCSHYKPAPGLWNSLMEANPTVWFPYKKVEPGFAEVESKHFQKVLKDNGLAAVEMEEVEGQFMLPLFFGTIPVYVLVVLSQRIAPEFFTRRFLESMFDSMTEIGESILEEQFESIWQQYAIKLVKNGNVTDEDAASFFKGIWDIASARDSFSWIHSLPGHSLKRGKRGALVEQFASDFITQNARFWVRSRKDMLEVFQSNAKGELAFSRDDDHDCDGNNGEKTRKDAKNKIEKSEWWRVLWVKEKVRGWVQGVPSVKQCKELKAVLLPYDRNGNGRMSLALIEAWGKICGEYKDINVIPVGLPAEVVPIGNLDPYKLVDSIFWLLHTIGSIKSFSAKQQKNEYETSYINITLQNVPLEIKTLCETGGQNQGQCCEAYLAITNLIPGKFVVNNITEKTFSMTITL